MRTYLTIPALLLATSCGGGGDEAAGQAPDVYTLQRQTLRIALREQAELRAAQETRVRSAIEGRATIIELIPEGSFVQQGERLVTIDVSDLEDRRANQAITVERADAALINAQQNVEILEKELAADQGRARSALEIAEIDLEKFLGRPRSAEDIARMREALAEAGGISAPVRPPGDDGDPNVQTAIGLSTEGSLNVDVVRALNVLTTQDETTRDERFQSLGETLTQMICGEEDESENLFRDVGELGQQVLEQIDAIRLAKQRLALAEDTYRNSLKLAEQNYVTRNQLERDELDWKSNQSQVELAWQRLDVLVSYTLRRTQIDLQLKLSNAVIELERTLASAKARRAREQAELKSKQSEYNLALERLENFEQQIENGAIDAPTPGLVVYAATDSRRGEFIEEGQEVRDRQTILILPDITRMLAELKIQEADVNAIEIGQPATVRVEAYEGRTFSGVIQRVSPVADSGSRFSNDNRKVYKTWVEIQSDNEGGLLKPNMAAWVEILVDEIPDTLAVPITAIRREGSLKYVWKIVGDSYEPVAVEIGRNSTTEVEIAAGLQEGDQIYLAPPSGAVVSESLRLEAERRTKEEQVRLEAEAKRLAAEAAARAADDPLQSEEFQQKLKAVSSASFQRELLEKHPEFRETIEAGGRWFMDEEIRSVISADPELQALSEALMQKMMRNRGQGGGRGRGPGGRQGG
ncbi:MAG: efflux RND transporter periplasmic adaptor subunit [Planctomycetota bacterium]